MSEDRASGEAAPDAPTRRRGGVRGMVVAELRDLACSLGVEDTTGMRRNELIAEIKKRQPEAAADPGVHVAGVDLTINGADYQLKITDPSDDHVEGGIKAATAETADDGNGDAEFGEVADQPPAVNSSAGASAGPPPPARLLSLAALLLAPEERENWLCELRTSRWELRADPKARRRETWTHARALGASFIASWRFRGDPAEETS